METRKSHFTYKDILFKGKRMTIMVLAIAVGTGIAVNSKLQTEIPVHDGDVLVDSLSISEEKERDAAGSGTFEEQRASLELERNKLIAALDSTISSSSVITATPAQIFSSSFDWD